MRVSPAITSALGLVLAACGGGDLVVLHPRVALTPTHRDVVAWIGTPARASFTVANTGPVAVDVHGTVEGAGDGLRATIAVANGANGLADANGASGANGGGGANGAGAGASFVLARGASVDVVVSLDADRELAADLVVRAASADPGVPAATATLHVEVRTPPVCASSDPCDDVRFDPDVGACVHTPHPDGEACDDGSLCTEDDRCSSGACVGRAVTCHDDVDCTVDTCDPLRGCVFEPVDSRCADDNACSDDRCDVHAGCVHTTLADGSPCGTFSCDSFHLCALGACVATPTPDGFPCEDGDLCTTGDACQGHVCVAGTPTSPVASPPVALARAVVHVVPDERMFTSLVGDVALIPPFDVTPDFGAVLDVTQAIVGTSPTLAVLWKTAPFGFDGPCSPWDPLAVPAAEGDAAFCGTALVVTFVDEAALVAANGAVGTPVVLGVMYGTVGATFVDRAPTDVQLDDLQVVALESTYAPRPDGLREIAIHNVALSFSARAVVAHDIETDSSGPFSGLESNVHEGLRVAANQNGVAFLGWDIAHSVPFGGDDPAADAAVPVSPPMDLSLDVGRHLTQAPPGGLGAMEWDPLLADLCDSGPPAPGEDVTFADVQLAQVNDGVGGRAFGIVRHGVVAGDPEFSDSCVVGTELSFVDLGPSGATVSPAAVLSSTAVHAASIAHGAEVLAVVDEHFNDCASLPCPAYALDLLPTPWDTADPVVALPSFALDANAGAAVTRVAALTSPGGALGAVVATVDADGAPVLRLIDHVGGAQPLDLASPVPFFGVNALGVAQTSLAALRSPLSAQSVYAVAPSNLDPYAGTVDGVVVRFGCPFPTAPAP